MEDMSRAHGVLLSGRFQESRNNDLGERAMPLSPWRWYGGFVITRHLLFIPIYTSRHADIYDTSTWMVLLFHHLK